MDAEDALVLADAICVHTGASVRSLGALIALAALVKPHIAGMSVFANTADHCAYIGKVCQELRPLSSHNEVLATALCAVVTENL